MSLTYEDAPGHSGLGILIARRKELCKSFMNKFNKINVNNNPVAQVINALSEVPEHNYRLRTQPTNQPFTSNKSFYPLV